MPATSAFGTQQTFRGKLFRCPLLMAKRTEQGTAMLLLHWAGFYEYTA